MRSLRSPLQGLRRLCSVVLVVALGAAGLVVLAPAAPSSAAPAFPLGVTFSDRSGAAASAVSLPEGSTGLTFVTITNMGSSPFVTSTPLVVSVSLPAGMSIVSQSSAGRRGISGDLAPWSCTTGSSAVCTQSPLSGRSATFGRNARDVLALQVSDDNVVAGTSGLVAQATASVGQGTSAAARAGITVTPRPPASGVALSVGLPRQARAGQSFSATYQVSNPSPYAAVTGRRGVRAVTLGSMLPAGKVESWSFEGSGWACTSDAGGIPVCGYTTTIGPGGQSSPLTLHVHLAPGERARSLSPTLSPTTWTLALREHTASRGTISGSVAQSMTIVPLPPGKLMVSAAPLRSSTLLPGGTVAIAIKNHAIDGFASGITDSITLPAGMATEAVSSDGWTCPAASGTVRCTHAGAVAAKADPTLVVTIDGASDLAAGVKVVSITGDAIDGEASSTTAVPLFSFSFGGPRLQIVPMPDGSSLTPMDASQRTVLTPGRGTEAVFRVRNVGTKAIPAGSTLSMTMSVPDALRRYDEGFAAAEMPVVLSKGTSGQRESCTVASDALSLVCTVVLPSALDPTRLSDPFSVTILDRTAIADVAADRPSGVSVADQQDVHRGHVLHVVATVTGLDQSVAPTSYDVTARNPVAVPDLSARLSLPSKLLEGGPSQIASVVLRNTGAAEPHRSTVVMAFPSARFEVSPIDSSTCEVSTADSSTTVVTCSFDSLGQGSVAQPSISAPATFTLRNIGATSDQPISLITSDGTVDHSSTTIVKVDVSPTHLLPPSNLSLGASGGSSGLSVRFDPPGNAPERQRYELTICRDDALRVGCRHLPATSGMVVGGLAQDTTYFCAVRALASPGYLEADSSVATGATNHRIGAMAATTAGTGASPEAVPTASGTALPSAPVVPAVVPVAPRSPAVRGALAAGTHGSSPAIVPSAVGKSFCDLFGLVSSSTPATMTEDLGGGVSATLDGVVLSSGASCSSEGAAISFTGGTLDLAGQYAASIGSGSITAAGLSVSTATLTTPAWWGPGSSLSLTSSALSLPFAGAEGASSVSVSATFTASGLFGLPTPPGWTAQTSMTFGICLLYTSDAADE